MMALRDRKPPGYRTFCIRFRAMGEAYSRVLTTWVDASSRDYAESIVRKTRPGCAILPPIKRNKGV